MLLREHFKPLICCTGKGLNEVEGFPEQPHWNDRQLLPMHNYCQCITSNITQHKFGTPSSGSALLHKSRDLLEITAPLGGMSGMALNAAVLLYEVLLLATRDLYHSVGVEEL